MIAFAAFAFAWAGAQTSGGPDAYGYEWRNSDNANGPTYQWIDITGKGTQLTGFADDNSVGPISMGFDFHWYWQDYNEVKIGSNGWLSFKTSTGNIAHCFPTFPSPGGNSDDYIGPFMTDLNFAGAANPGEVWYWSNSVDTFIVSFINAPWWRNGNPDYIGSNTFQVIYAGQDSSVTIMYADMDQVNLNNIGSCNADLEIGWENVTGNVGLEILLETVPDDFKAYKIYYPQVVTLSIPDVTPFWLANSENQGQFVLTGGNVSLTANIKNVGNADVNATTSVSAQVRDLPQNTVYSATSTVDTLTAGASQTVTFTPAWSLTTPGQYYYEVGVTNAQDINPSNNSNIVEISAVSIVQGQCTTALSYATQNPPDGSVAWSGGGGGDGAGIKVVPPGYPAVITSVDMFIRQGAFNPANNSAYDVVILDDDGPNGTPGTQLVKVTMAEGSYTPEDWVNTSFTTPVTVNDGAFYVAWIMGGDSIALGSEAFGPISRRTFEILSGSWATYRQSTVEDFLINVNIDACSIGRDDEIAKSLTSFTNFPNPTDAVQYIRFNMTHSAEANFTVVNMHGQTVYSKTYGTLSPGQHEFSFSTDSFSPGVYFVSMEVEGQRMTNKMVVTR
ncbi:MAG: T9SS type A sorting domain-containing protein [Bacteroidia bacterium]|nr:T9SS type A sorting domain-containing protein [Bacteroidia bacterium]